MALEKQWSEAEAHWREYHGKQSYADEKLKFEDYVPAYRLGHEAAIKHTGKKFEDVEDEIALNYEKARPDGATPWDTVRPAVRAEWDRLAGILGPRDSDRGLRGAI